MKLFMFLLGRAFTSQGRFHEALNWASNLRAPVISYSYNEYAIYLHTNQYKNADSVYSISSGYRNLSRYNVDGVDFFETNLASLKRQ
ncbi:MAG: hypothetical protein CM15mP4_0050 [Candidatus Neomarinimicrobiota bacterium]|nr:MAG: hypothetical protein CM15mP4_0050 [Candidatus Neomarinimicrobiota bacterium]